MVNVESARVAADLPYREFYYPLNVFMHVLTHEEGTVNYLHYGLFEDRNESIATAQERSTGLLLERLPPPPATILEVGIGLGTTLARLTELGYDATGITPDAKQIAMARSRHDSVRIENIAFEDLRPQMFDVVVFQESSQYIESSALFEKAAQITSDVIVVDEFAVRAGGSLHQLDDFVWCAIDSGFKKVEDVDLSARAAPTIDYFLERLPRYRSQLVADLGLSPAQVDDLITSGKNYRALYEDGTYVYRLLRFRKG